jgi:hypothetical protein
LGSKKEQNQYEKEFTDESKNQNESHHFQMEVLQKKRKCGLFYTLSKRVFLEGESDLQKKEAAWYCSTMTDSSSKGKLFFL